MQHYYNKETHVDLEIDFPNVIRENKVHVLPVIIQNFAVVEIYLTERQNVVIESQHSPIRYGRHCATRIHLGSYNDKVDYNPKFIWNGKEWLLHTFGTFQFAEVEFNHDRS